MSAYLKWWIFGPLIGLLTLANIRCQLLENNLFDTYATGEWPSVVCEPESQNYRTADGSCNDFDLPAMGMAGARMGRNIQPDYSWQDTDKLLTPNPRDVSKELLTRDEGIKEVPFLNYIATAWIQFMVHDWFEHGNRDHSDPIKVPVDSGDIHDMGDGHMNIGRTPADPTRVAGDGRPDSYINDNTAWWDGSQIYGSDKATMDSLRSFQDGKMILVDGRLPIEAETGKAKTGFNKNWWVGLEILHTLFVMEHNQIADMLLQSYPDWDDERVFQTARLINAAEIAKIHTVDWTPGILKNDILRQAMFANWRGLLPSWVPRLGEPATDGIMGGGKILDGVPFSLTEEFTAVYRMHPLLRDEFPIRDHVTDEIVRSTTLLEHSFTGGTQLTTEVGLTDLFYSFGRTKPGLLVLNNYPDMLTNFTAEPGGGVVDLAAVDILRDRERGLPRYNEFRRQIGLKAVNDFTDITPDTEMAEKMRAVYNDDIEALDVMVGSFAEGYRPPGYGFGETSFQIFIAMASRRLMADRFFTEDYRKEIYSQEGLDWIDSVTFNSVLVRNLPELAGRLENVGNAFFPWDEENEWYDLKVRK